MEQLRVDRGRPPAIDRSSATTDRDGASLSIDEVCHLLQNERRRNVLRYLRDTDDHRKIGEIAETAAAIESDTPIDQLHHDDRKRVYIALYQVHLPKLADSGVIDYDKDRGTVAPTNAAQRLYDAMDAITGTATDRSHGRSSSNAVAKPIAGVALLSGVLLVLAAGNSGQAIVPAITIFLILLAYFAGLSINDSSRSDVS